MKIFYNSNFKFISGLLLLFMLLGVKKSWGQILWSASGSSVWLTGSNWTGSSVPLASDIAQFGVNPTGTAGVGINYSNATNAGTQINGSRIQEVGAIEITSARAASFSIGNSSATAGATGTFRPLGITVNSIANTILRNNSNQTFTIQNTQGSGTQTMAVALGNATDNVVNVDGSGNIIISSNISSLSSRKLTLNANSSGDLRLSGTNSWDGGTNVLGGTAGGRLRIDAVASLPTSGTVAVSTGGRITLNTAGTYGSTSQVLTFNPNQTTNPSLDILSGAAVIWQGTVAINAETRIEANGATGTLIFSNNVSGSGTLIKQAAGTLVLSGTGNTATGGTQIGNGTITVNSGSLMGTGGVIMSQTGTNNTAINLNNAAQTISSLQSNWTATTGTQTQTLTLGSEHTLTINQSSNTTFGNGAVSTLQSILAGSGNIIKSGSGTLTLSGANTYTGSTTINAGAITLGNASGGTIPSSNAVVINNGGTLNVNTDQTLSNLTLNTGGNLVVNSPATLTLSANMTLNGNITVNSGATLAISNGATITVTQPLQISGTINLNSTGVITGSSTTFTLNSGATIITGNTSGVSASTGTFSTKTFNNAANYLFNGTSNQVCGLVNTTVNNITTNNSAGVNLDTDATVNGTLSVQTGTFTINSTRNLTLNGSTNTVSSGQTLSVNGILNLNSNVLNGTGSFSINNGGTLITSNINGVTGSTASSGSIQMSPSSNETYNDGANYIFNGTAAQSTGFIGNGGSISTPQIANAGNIHIANTSAAVTQDGDLQGTSGLTATLSIPGNAIYVLPATVNINKGTGGIVSVAGTIRTGDANGFSNTSTANLQGFSGTSDIVLGTNSVVEYNGGTQVVTNQIPYQNVLFSSSSTKTPAGNTSVIGNVSLTGSGPLNLGSNTFSFGGNWYSTSQSNLSEQTSIVNWNGTGTQNITVTGGVENFYILSVSGTGTLNLNNNVTVGSAGNGGLSIASGTLDAGTNSLSASASNLLTISGGTLRLAKTGVTLPEITGANNLSGGTIELYGNGNQALSGTPTYNNLIFSNNANTTITSGITLVTAAGVLIKDNAILNVDNRSFGGTSNTLTMTGSSKFINAGSGVKPDLGGNYALGSGTTIEFSGTSNTTLRLTPVYQNIIISGSAGDRALPSAASTLQVQGNFTNYYTGLSNGFVSNGGTVRLNGTNQTIGGIKNTEFATLVVENNGTKTITNAGVSIRNVLSFAGTSTSINNAGSSVILLSSATNTARLAQVPTGCSYIGNMTMQRYMAGSGSKQLVNYQLASPVSGAPVSHWQPTNMAPSVPTNGFYISGNFIGKDVPTLTGISAGSLASLLTYNSTIGGYSQFPIASNTEILTVGTGYRGIIRDGTAAFGFTTIAGKTLSLTGNPTIGDFAFSLTSPASNTLTSWNFIGNPYPSEIDGDLSNTLNYPINTDINNAVYVYNSAAVGYNTYINGMGTAAGGGAWDGKIPSSQGFWVQSNNTNPALTITENAKTTGSTTLLRTESPVYYRIKLQNNNGLDETLIAISDNATYNFDGKFDAEKLNAPISNGQPSLRTESKNGTKLTINTIPSDKIQPFDTVWISYNSGLKNNHTFDFYSFETFDDNIDVFLIDKFSDSISNMKTQKEYTFANTTFSGKRFAVVHKTQLRVETPTNQNNTTETTNVNFQNLELHFDIIPNPFENQTFEIKTNSSILESQLKISNLLGQNIPFEIKNNGNNNYKIILLENRKGIYFIHIQTEKFASIKKVIAK